MNFEPDVPDDYVTYEVTCARCGKVGLNTWYCIEEGDEWECPPCNARENARERAEHHEYCDTRDPIIKTKPCNCKGR